MSLQLQIDTLMSVNSMMICMSYLSPMVIAIYHSFLYSPKLIMVKPIDNPLHDFHPKIHRKFRHARSIFLQRRELIRHPRKS